MNHLEANRRDDVPPWALPLMAGISLASSVITYQLALSSLPGQLKTLGLLGIVVGLIVLPAVLYFRNKNRSIRRDNDLAIQHHLDSLSDANEFFAGSLKPEDAFRLISSRVMAIAAFDSFTILLASGSGASLRVAYGRGTASSTYADLAKRSLSSGDIQVKGKSSAIPLRDGGQPFGVLHLSSTGQLDVRILDAIGTRVAPLIKRSIAREQSQATALTDSTTGLPNERAFYVVLENQIAEAQRRAVERPLTILAVDINDFDELNTKFGHAAGDRVLKFAARTMQTALRQMDLLARSISDEFLVVLPTASHEIARDVATRIRSAFLSRRFEIALGEWIEIEVTIGSATFGEHGDTSTELLAAARLRKDQQKSGVPPRVVWFPTELAQ